MCTKSVTDSTEHLLEILRDIDFRLAPRRPAAIVGASRVGQEHTLSIIAGLDTPTRGTVLLAGQDLFAGRGRARRATRAPDGLRIPELPALGNLTALENVMLPLELAGSSRRAPPRNRDAGAAWVWASACRTIPKVLSGGEQQRVALARAFVSSRPCCLAGRPTGNLDFATGGNHHGADVLASTASRARRWCRWSRTTAPSPRAATGFYHHRGRAPELAAACGNSIRGRSFQARQGAMRAAAVNNVGVDRLSAV